MAYRFIQENQDRYTVREMAALLGVSCSAYYRWATYGVSQQRRKVDAFLVDLMWAIQEKHHYRYGSPRVREELRNSHGKRVSGPVNAGKRLKRQREEEIHRNH